MKRKSVLLGSSLLATIALAACQDQVTQPAARSARLDASDAAGLAVTRLSATLPAGSEVADLPDADLVAAAINPKDYPSCAKDAAASGVNAWINGKINQSLTVEPDRFFTAYDLAADQVPEYEQLYITTGLEPQYFGHAGEHTHDITKAEKDIKRFWAIDGDRIHVVAMHGAMLMDTLRVAKVYTFVYGIPAPVAAEYAREMRAAVDGSQTMPNGDHPFFTFNSIAFTTFGGPFPDKIVMGDGIMQVYDELGFGDVAPDAIFAHEYAHHVQYQKGYRTTGTAAERTRYNELGADMMSAYFLTHSRGEALNRKRVEEFLQVFFQIGDCGFTSSGHHGTPAQRMAAARTGFDLADQAQKQGHIMTPDEVESAFIAALPKILAPDAK